MPEHRTCCGEDRGFLAEQSFRDQDCSGRFQTVENERQRRQRLTSGAKDVCCADVAGTEVPDIALARETRQDKAEGDGPQEIAKRQGKDHLPGHRDGW